MDIARPVADVSTTVDDHPPARPRTIRILVADDHALILDMLVATLSAIEGFEVVGAVHDGRAVVPAALQLRPTVSIINMAMVGCDSFELAQALRTAFPLCGVAFVAVKPTRPLVERAIAAGALSVIPRHARLRQLVDAIRGVAAGCLTLDPELVRAVKSNSTLSQRERQVLTLTSTGASMQEIAAELFLSVGTVRNLASASIKKLAGRNRFDAARIAQEQGWL